MRKYILFSFLFVAVFAVAQKNKTIDLGRTTLDELKMTVYENDSTANAVVLFEKGHVYFNLNSYNNYTKEYYVRIKILNRSALKKANIKIPFYKASRVENIEAITYNLSDSGKIVKSILAKEDIFKEKVNKSYRIKSFALPNVKVGSVIEYKFTYTRYGYGVYNWSFQSDIPKIKSIYKAYLSGRPKFKIRMIGFLKPSIEKTSLKKKCVGISRCSELYFEMDSIPAFKEEKYLTNKNNYLSQIKFEREYKNPYVGKGKNREWKILDKGFTEAYKYSLNMAGYYRRKMPSYLFKEKDLLKKAKGIYNYIQKRFTRDEYSDEEFVDIFEKKIASPDQINLALYNAFIAAELNADLTFISTRENGFVTKLHATVNDFDYIIVKLKINQKEYFLDAADKKNPFGLLSFECLNGDGRVLNFKKGSYWQNIVPTIRSNEKIQAHFSLKEDNLIGDISITRNGYYAKIKRKSIDLVKEEDYLDNFESKNPDLNINVYKRENERDLAEPLKEKFNVSIEIEDKESIKINPFLLSRLTTNPFKLNERSYPIDYGFKRSKRYLFSLIIPEDYLIKSLPKNLALRLPNKGGMMMLTTMQKGNTITLLYKFNLNRRVFYPVEYQVLKEFYSQVIKTQDTYIELEKK